MNKLNTTPKLIDLQLFADGAGADGGGTAATGTEGVTAAAALPQTKAERNNPLANVKYGKQEDTKTAPIATVAADDRNAQFEALIKGEYKDLYDAKMQDTIQKRLKGSKEVVDKYNKLAPTLDALARKYGVDSADVDALNKAIEEDDSYFEDEALERGVPVEELKAIKKMERENAELKQQMQEQQNREKADELYTSWIRGEKETQQFYPGFSLKAEMNNKAFTDLLKAGIDVKTAFEVVHKDEIMPAAMQYTAKTVQQKLANSIAANGARPIENGMSAQSAATIKSDVSQLTKADRAEIARRVARGEKIRF